MVSIRLKRIGRKHQPHYRVVVTDSRNPRDGRFIAELGWFDPRSAKDQIKLDAELAKSWIAKGAQPSDTVRGLLVTAGVLPKTAPKPSTKKPSAVRNPEKRRKTKPAAPAAEAAEAPKAAAQA
ncbi:MAG: 30S ribosomal protein S16 [Spirochaetes bacterium]|nr:30S ribosomal protein S16 [Spirochaetota bacterium]